MVLKKGDRIDGIQVSQRVSRETCDANCIIERVISERDEH
jgi:hypothetical protein